MVKRVHNEATRPEGTGTGFALERLFELAVLLTDAMEAGLAERGLTRARAELLWRLHRQGPMTQRELSQAMRCSPRNVTGLVDALQANRLVTRQPHPTDRRATLVTLTQHGASTATAINDDYQQGAAMLLGDIPAEELAGFLATLDRVLDRLRPSTPVTLNPH